MKKIFMLLILSFLVIASLSFAFADSSSSCPADTQQCSDGSSVSRNSNNNCEFDSCPIINNTQVCTDSDGGLMSNNIFIKGKVKGIFYDYYASNRKYVEVEDRCIDENDPDWSSYAQTDIKEYFCIKNINNANDNQTYVMANFYKCPNGCYNGACIIPNATHTCSTHQCEDGSIAECKMDENSGSCICESCPPIIIQPECGNGVCEAGEGEICQTKAAVPCEVGKKCEAQQSKCYYRCEEDCKNIQGIYAKLDEKFKLQISQQAKITDYKNMKIIFRDLITSKCAEAVTEAKNIKSKLTGNAIASDSATASPAEGNISIIKCPAVGPMAQLEVEMPESEGRKILTLKLNEGKDVYGVNIAFLGYDFASRTGVFVVNSQTYTCPEMCKCDSQGNSISCMTPPTPLCSENLMLCPDNICREKCEITNSSANECTSGCLYNDKCLPFGMRVKGMFCSLDNSLTSQLNANEVCENNFECSSNVCLNGKCVSSGLIKKFFDWFSKIFG